MIRKYHLCILIKRCRGVRLKAGQRWPIIPFGCGGVCWQRPPSHHPLKFSSASFFFRLFSIFQNNIIPLRNACSEIHYFRDIRSTCPSGGALIQRRIAMTTKEEYIELINQLMESCNDLTTLDLVYGILARL